MSIYVIGINHKTAPIALREKAYFASDKLTLYLQDLLITDLTHEAVILSTCNRSELYCETDDITAIQTWFRQQTTLTLEEFETAIYLHQDEAAIIHIMSVACGLDSMILGEPQILGQMKEAFSESCTAGTVGTLFHRLFQHIFAVAKEIRTTSAIGACPVSVASAAEHFAKDKVANFSNANIVVIGAGDTTALFLRYLSAHEKTKIKIVNRNLEHAKELAENFHAKAYDLDHLSDALKDADIVFSATGSPLPIVKKEMVATIMQDRSEPLIFIDVAVPRDIEMEVNDLPNVSLYCIDDLKIIIEKNRQGREHAAHKARELINKKSIELIAEIQSFEKVADAIRAYRKQIEKICHTELMKAKQQLNLGKDPTLVLDHFAHAFVKKLLHAPSVQLRQAARSGEADLLQFAKQLFAISEPETERL